MGPGAAASLPRPPDSGEYSRPESARQRPLPELRLDGTPDGRPHYSWMERQRPQRDSSCGWLAAVLLALLASALPAPAPAQSRGIEIDIQGLDGELLDAVRGTLALQHYVDRDVTAAQARRLHGRAEREVRRALEPYGYYNPEVDTELEQQGERFVVRVHVEPGPPTLVRELDLQVQGPAGEEPLVRRAVEGFEPRKGARLDHAEYEESKRGVDAALTMLGYFDARLTQSRVAVTRRANAADIDLSWESGERYRLGEVRFSESQFPEGFLRRFVTFEEGDPYSADALIATQQRLVDADYFSAVAVRPDTTRAEDGTVPVEVMVVPATPTVYSVGLYYGTDSGPGVRFGLERRWMNDRGHKLRGEGEYSQRLQALRSTYTIPRPGPHEKSYNFGLALREQTTETSESRTARLAANDTRQWRGFTRTLGLQYLGGDFEVASERGSSNLLFAEGALARMRADNVFFPRRGYAVNLTLRAAPELLMSDTHFVQLSGDARWIRALGEHQRLLLRSSFGAMTVGDFSALPPELRFFAGGDRSIRGFDFESLGTTNAAGEVIGGEYLAVGSATLEHYFDFELLGTWGLAAFVDAGDAFQPGEFDLNVGAGLGVRWRSPLGMVRIDLARAVRSPVRDDTWRLHLVIGPDL